VGFDHARYAVIAQYSPALDLFSSRIAALSDLQVPFLSKIAGICEAQGRITAKRPFALSSPHPVTEHPGHDAAWLDRDPQSGNDVVRHLIAYRFRLQALQELIGQSRQGVVLHFVSSGTLGYQDGGYCLKHLNTIVTACNVLFGNLWRITQLSETTKNE